MIFEFDGLKGLKFFGIHLESWNLKPRLPLDFCHADDARHWRKDFTHFTLNQAFLVTRSKLDGGHPLRIVEAHLIPSDRLLAEISGLNIMQLKTLPGCIALPDWRNKTFPFRTCVKDNFLVTITDSALEKKPSSLLPSVLSGCCQGVNAGGNHVVALVKVRLDIAKVKITAARIGDGRSKPRLGAVHIQHIFRRGRNLDCNFRLRNVVENKRPTKIDVSVGFKPIRCCPDALSPPSMLFARVKHAL